MSRDLRRGAFLIGIIFVALTIYFYWSGAKNSDDSFTRTSILQQYAPSNITLTSKAVQGISHNFHADHNSRWKIETRKREKASIALVMIVKDLKNEKDYRIARNSARCYAEVQEYGFIYVDYSANQSLQDLCPQKDFFFTRHCLMKDVIHNTPYEFFVFLDADIGVINPERRIEDFLPKEESVNVMFYNRFYNDEIMAGSYIVRKSKQAEDFLQLWVDYLKRTENFTFSGTDNGCIQSVVLEFFASDLNEFRAICEKTWQTGRGFDELFRYEACAQYLLTLISKEELAKRGFILYEKGEGWSRDGWISGTWWCERDLFFHGWKQSKLGGEWKLPFTRQDLFDQKCSQREFTRWNHTASFKVPCLKLDLKLHIYYLEKRKAYYERLQELLDKNLFPAQAYEKFGIP